jgi:hypothetical protein
LYLHILLFADDGVILANTEAQLKDKLEILQKTLNEIGLQLNSQKTKIMIFAKRKPASQATFTWNEEALEVVDDFCYLGVKFHRNGGFQRAAKAQVGKAAAATMKVSVKTAESLY